MSKNQDINFLISKAKFNIMQKKESVFLSALVCQLETVVTEEIPTGATDGKRILINPDFFMKLTKEEQAFLLAHEALHVAYMHPLRRGTKDPIIWNMAGDYVINLDLKNAGFSFINGGLLDSKYVNKSTEEIYCELVEELQGKAPSEIDGLGNDIIYNKDAVTKAELEEIEQEIQTIVTQATTHAQMAGNIDSIPTTIRQYLIDKAKPKVNWKVLLRSFMSDLSKEDYSFKRFNRRYIDSNIYLPSLISDGLSKISFAIDTSGSITKEQFNQFMGEIYAVMRLLNPNEIDVMQFDHELRGLDTVKSLKDLAHIEFKGHGGTEPNVALKRFKETKNSKALIVITDGYFYTSNLINPKRPVLWVVFDNNEFTAPFGKTIHFNLGT